MWVSPRSQKKTGSFNPEIYRLRVSDRLAVLPEESYEKCELAFFYLYAKKFRKIYLSFPIWPTSNEFLMKIFFAMVFTISNIDFSYEIAKLKMVITFCLSEPKVSKKNRVLQSWDLSIACVRSSGSASCDALQKTQNWAFFTYMGKNFHEILP